MGDYSRLYDDCCKHFWLVKCPGIEFPNLSTHFCCWQWTLPSSLLFLLPPSHSLISLLFPHKDRKVGCNLSLHLKPVSLYPFQRKEDQGQAVCSLPSSLSKNWTGARFSPWQSWVRLLDPLFSFTLSTSHPVDSFILFFSPIFNKTEGETKSWDWWDK